MYYIAAAAAVQCDDIAAFVRYADLCAIRADIRDTRIFHKACNSQGTDKGKDVGIRIVSRIQGKPAWVITRKM